MTLKEFLQRLHELGVKDDDELIYIDVTFGPKGSKVEIDIERDERGVIVDGY